jgi:hypothetical protein
MATQTLKEKTNFMEPKITAFARTRHWSQCLIKSTLPSYFFEAHLCFVLPSGLFPEDIKTNTVAYIPVSKR